ncbi:MAG: YibE/F family protein [Oscillospiraceae bacterium]|nr:YibE/F family protein [Oscillospiraceae bacterium]
MIRKSLKNVFFAGAMALCIFALLAGCAERAEPGVPDPVKWAQIVESGQILNARVLSFEVSYSGENESGDKTTLFTAEITSGEAKGTKVSGRIVELGHLNYKVAPLRVGSRIFVRPDIGEDGMPMCGFEDYDRTWGLIFIVVLFAVILCIIGGMKGFRSLVALIVTCLGLALIFIPMVRAGQSPVGASLLVCTLVTIATLLIIGGVGVKTISSLLGIMTGVFTAGVLVAIMQSVMRLTGLIDEHAQMLSVEGLDMNGLMFAAILIGALGAAMDVAVSLSSALEELNIKTGMNGLELVRSGMKIGRDMMGTMTNTLVLAYVGGSLHLVMLLATDLRQFGYIISWELLATEILRAIAGSIGLIVIVPATSVISALLYRRKSGVSNPFS